MIIINAKALRCNDDGGKRWLKARANFCSSGHSPFIG